MYHFKETFILGLLLAMATFKCHAQTPNTNLLPYNPDVDGNGSIEANDLLGFLSYFGMAYVVEGTLPIEFGGTGASTSEAARLGLALSVFSDLPQVEGLSSGGQVSGSLNIEGALTQGENSEATGSFSVGLNRSVASGDCSVAQGESTVATALGSHSEGMLTYSSGIGSHAEGMQTLAQSNYTHSEGFQTQALNISAHAEGYGSVASGLYSHAENRYTVANATCAHAEGEGTSALAAAAHSEGYETTADGFASHAQGYQTTSSGNYSHAGGRSSLASATGATAMGNSIIADQQYSTVVGEYNKENIAGALFVVGNGVHESSRSNILEVTSTDAQLKGDLNVTGMISANGVNLETEIVTNQVDIQILILEIQNLQTIVAQLQTQIDSLTP